MIISALQALEKKTRELRLAICAFWLSLQATGALLTFIFITLGIINFIHDLLHIELLSPFETTFSGARRLLHFIMYWLVYHWFVLAFGAAYYAITKAFSFIFLTIVPFWPHIFVPGWFINAALISMILLRLFEGAYHVIPREKREEAANLTTREQMNEMIRIQGPFWGPIHRATDIVNKGLWDFTDYIWKKIIYIPHLAFPNHEFLFVKRIIVQVLGALVLWGYIRLVGYVVFVYSTWGISYPTVISRRKVAIYFIVCFSAALIGAAWFFAINFYIMDLDTQQMLM